MDRYDLSPLLGSHRDLLPESVLIAEPEQDPPLEVTIRLRSKALVQMPSPEVLERIAASRQYLSPRQYEDRYGANPEDVKEVRLYAEKCGLEFEGTRAGDRLIMFSGPRTKVEEAFNTPLRYYDSGRGRYRGRSGFVNLPFSLAHIVEGVFGLDSRPQAIPFIRTLNKGGSDAVGGCEAVDAPLALQEYYNFPAELTGRKQRVGILEFGGGFSQQVVDEYFATLGKPKRSIASVCVGASNDWGGDHDDEVALDIEVAGALAPEADLVVYFAPRTEKGWIDALAASVFDEQYSPSVISISWGFPEGPPNWTLDGIEAVEDLLTCAALFGITVCAASGDKGSSIGRDSFASAAYPASSTLILSVGGTCIATLEGARIEKVWNESGCGGDAGASGGGISDDRPRPPWQEGIEIAGDRLPMKARADFPGRCFPDVAAVASRSYLMRHSQAYQRAGGTSASAPLWASLIARINEKLGRVGLFAPILYRGLGSQVCFDVETGNNCIDDNPGYKAAKGWDACTGWGSPNGGKLLSVLSTLGQPGVFVPILSRQG